MSAASEIGESVFNEAEVEDLLDKSEQLIYSLSQDLTHQDFVPVKETLEVTFERLDELSKKRGTLRGSADGT